MPHTYSRGRRDVGVSNSGSYSDGYRFESQSVYQLSFDYFIYCGLFNDAFRDLACMASDFNLHWPNGTYMSR
jgi:hypothetical protein